MCTYDLWLTFSLHCSFSGFFCSGFYGQKNLKNCRFYYLNGLLVSDFGESCVDKFYLQVVLLAHCSIKFTYTLFSARDDFWVRLVWLKPTLCYLHPDQCPHCGLDGLALSLYWQFDLFKFGPIIWRKKILSFWSEVEESTIWKDR